MGRFLEVMVLGALCVGCAGGLGKPSPEAPAMGGAAQGFTVLETAEVTATRDATGEAVTLTLPPGAKITVWAVPASPSQERSRTLRRAMARR